MILYSILVYILLFTQAPIPVYLDGTVIDSSTILVTMYLKKNQSTPRPSEHPPVMGGKCQNVKGAVYTVWTFICICMSLRVFKEKSDHT